MAEDLERLVVQLSADLTRYQRELGKLNGITDRAARQAEARFATMNKRLDSATAGIGRNLTASLGAIGSALAIKEVGNYADAWTKAKNALAVAGVTGAANARVLEGLYQSAQRNAAPIGSLADLYGKAAQSQKELGASSADLMKFSDGVAVSLKVAGKSSTEASGALGQLGQLLGSARVQAEEFNSINEGARPILMAVANGLDAAGGSVAKLKKLVNDGAVSNRDFFNAFLKGMPAVEAMAANATQTIEQGFVKVQNALTRYIGQQDQSLGATRVLSGALNALADDFENIADITLKVAAVIAAALVGRAIGGMIASLGVAGAAVFRFLAALNAAKGVGAAFTGLAGAAGPIGAILTVAATAGLYFATAATEAEKAAERGASSIRELGLSGKSTASDIDKAAEALRKLSEVQRNAKRTENDALISTKSNELGRVSLSDIGVNGRASTQEGRRLAGILYDLNKRAREGKIAQEAYNKSLDELVAKNPKLQKIAEQYQEIASHIFAAQKNNDALNKSIDATSLPKTDGAQRRAAEDASMSAYERGKAETQRFLDQRKLEDSNEREKQITEKAEEIAKALEKAGKLIDRAAIRIQAEKEVDHEASVKTSQDFAGDSVKQYVAQVVKVESSGNRFAKNGDSSATGLGQFIDSTWLNLFKKHFETEAKGMSDSAILALRTNAELSKKMIEIYARENADALRAAGNVASVSNLHLAHFLGAGDANKVLKAAPSTPLAGLISPKSIAANPTILGGGKTVDDAIAYADRRANSVRRAAGDLTPEEKSAKDFTDTIGDSRKRTEELQRETEAIKQGAYARAFAAEKARLLADVEKEGTDGSVQKATPEQLKQIEASADAFAKAEAGKVKGEQDKGFEDELKESDERTRSIGRETEGLGKLTYAREYAAEKARLLAAAEADGRKASEDDVRRIEEKAAAYAKAQTAQEDYKGSLEGLKEAQNFFADGATSAFTDIITGASTAKEAIRKLAASIAEAGIQALLTGKGPLGGLFGTAGKDGGVGGILGMLFNGFADGGVMTPNGPRALPRYAKGGVSNSAAIFGEAGPEAAVPLPDGRRIPVNLRMPKIGKVAPIPRGGGAITVKTSIDLTGANGDATIRRIAREAAEQGVASGLSDYDRNFRNRVTYMEQHE